MISSTTSWVTSLITDTYGNDGHISKKVTHTALIFFSVVLLQSLFQKFIFHCPDHHWVRFSYFCFFIPALPLFLIGWLSNIDFQNAIRGICHGCWNNEKRKRARMRIRWRYLIKTIIFSHVSAYVAPFSWFLMCLLNRRIMTCAVFGPPSLNNSIEVKRRYASLETYSQLIGFDLLVVGTACLVIILAVKQCFKKANPGKEICEFECLDNYASYEADAARKYFEEVMRAAAEMNGRRKVKMLLEARKPNVDNLEGVEKDMKEMSYEHFSSVRSSLMQIYPKTDNAHDKKLQLYTIEGWEEEARVFRKHLEYDKDFYGDKSTELKSDDDDEMAVTNNGEKVHLIDMNPLKYASIAENKSS